MEFQNDPSNWPYWHRAYLVFLVSSIAFMMQLGEMTILNKQRPW